MTPKTTSLACLSLVLLAAASAPARAADDLSLGLKPGLWESRTTRMTVDGTDTLAQVNAMAAQMKQQIASMPPAQRKQIEAALGQGGDGITARLCISPEMAQRGESSLTRPERASCDAPKVSRNGNRTNFELACTQDGAKLHAKGETVVAGDVITSRMESQRTAAGKVAAQTTVVEAQLKYLGKDCGNVRPLDQQARQAAAGKAAK